MTVEPTILVTPAIHVVTLVITGMSAAYVYRQRTTEYVQVKDLLVMVHLFYMGVVSLELVRNFVTSAFFLTVYTISNTSFVLADVVLLTLIAVAIYYRPPGKKVSDILRELGKHQTQATFFIIYMMYIAFAEGFLLAFPTHAFGVEQIPNLLGYTVAATQFDNLYLDVLLGVLLIFLAYPSSLLFMARGRTTDTEVRRALTILPIAWVGIGLDLLIFNGYLLSLPHPLDASAIGYLFAAAAFAVTAATFRRATLLSAFFLPSAALAPTVTPVTTFSGRLGLSTDRILGNEFLLEVNPSIKYEDGIRDLAMELGTQRHILFAFTSRGSPVYNSLSGMENVRFFTMTTKVSYPKPGEQPEEMMVPANDATVLLNVLDKAITSNPSLKMGVVFDSITDMLLSSGLEVTYKFLKQANEMINTHKVTSVFLMTLGAHSEREVNIVKSLFSNQLSYGTGHLAVLKAG